MDNTGKDTTEYVKQCASLMSDCFGGATSTEAMGYWVSNEEGLVKEKSTMVFSYCKDEDLKKYADDIIDFCFKMKEELEQEAISLEINGDMYFI